jgi:DNA-binding transcriptional LysR family regulator
LKSAFGRAGLEFHPRFQTQSALSVVAMVAAGLGVGFVTKLGAAQIITTGVTTLALADIEIGRDVGIVTVRGRRLSHAATTFCKILREVAPKHSKTRRR